MSCPVAPISAYLLRAFHVSLVTRHSGGGGGGGGWGGGDRYQDPWDAAAEGTRLGMDFRGCLWTCQMGHGNLYCHPQTCH